MKIGLFDSGLGGLSVLHEALMLLPKENYIYYADEKNVPYGEKTRSEILGYVDEAVGFMASRGVDVVVLACNTATSVAINDMRRKYSFPIIGMEPAVKKAVDLYGDKRVLVAATPVTVKGEKMKMLINKVGKEDLVDLVALPKLVRFAEKGEFNSYNVLKYLKDELSRFNLEEYSSIVLGCTHFNYFKDSLRKILPSTISFVDGNEGTINHLTELCNLTVSSSSEPLSECDNIEFYYSGIGVSEPNELERLKEYLGRLKKMYKVI